MYSRRQSPSITSKTQIHFFTFFAYPKPAINKIGEHTTSKFFAANHDVTPADVVEQSRSSEEPLGGRPALPQMCQVRLRIAGANYLGWQQKCRIFERAMRAMWRKAEVENRDTSDGGHSAMSRLRGKHRYGSRLRFRDAMRALRVRSRFVNQRGSQPPISTNISRPSERLKRTDFTGLKEKSNAHLGAIGQGGCH